MKASPPGPLGRRHLMELEPELCRALGRILPFSAHSLYFPAAHAPQEPQWIPRERTLLLPLRRGEELLGVFMARGVDGRLARRLLPSLPAVLDLCLDNLELTLQSRTDALTGLAQEHILLDRMRRDADQARVRMSEGDDDASPGAAPNGSATQDAPLYRACSGLMVVRCRALRTLRHGGGHAFADRCIRALAEALTQNLPDETLAARTGEGEFTLLIPAATPGACRKLAAALLARLDAVALTHPHSRETLRLRCAVGYALYPQDMDAAALPLPMAEQARMLLDKARLAADVARERHERHVPDARAARGRISGPERVMACGRMLAEGGMLRELQPMGRAVVSLGRRMGAAEGLRFAVWGRPADHDPARPDPDAPPVRKGEVVLLEVRDAHSVADTLYLTDPAHPLEPGDALTLLAPTAPLRPASTSSEASPPGDADAGTGLLRHGDFLRRLEQARDTGGAFSLALVRLAARPAAPEAENGDARAQNARGAAMEQLAGLCRQLPFSVGGRYGEASLAFVYDGSDAEAWEHRWRELCATAAEQGLNVAVGLASWPCLSFRRGEILECCRKALDLALLLPAPQVGVFGSLALNISADKRYSQGDVFGAVEEYKMALLADAGNALAWNSLGVCMAALSRQHEARRYFLEALKRQPGDAATCYNLGNVCQSLGETRAAGRYFRQCLKADPNHIFACIRLGQLAEKAGRRTQARQYYNQAARLEDAAPAPGALARRHLARVALAARKAAEARELLHEALHRDPQDAVALEMLAKVYLDGGEDPSMAEMLARRCVGLRPGHKAARQLLARALRALGREAEAREAEARGVYAGTTP